MSIGKIGQRKQLIAVVLLSICLVVGYGSTSYAVGLGDLLKIGGIGLVVDTMAKPLNNFINTLTFKKGAGNEYATKVVPIVTVGSQGYIGAVQVTGSQELIDRTQAVLQLEEGFGDFRVKALIPIDSKNPIRFSRVQGVGVSAIIDVRL